MQKQPLLGTRQHPYCCQQPQQIVGSWEQSRSDRKLTFQTRLFIQQSSKLCHTRNFWSWNWKKRTSQAFTCIKAVWPLISSRNLGQVRRQIVDKLLTSSVSIMFSQVKSTKSGSCAAVFAPATRSIRATCASTKTSFSNGFCSESDLVAIRRYLFTPQRQLCNNDQKAISLVDRIDVTCTKLV